MGRFTQLIGTHRSNNSHHRKRYNTTPTSNNTTPTSNRYSTTPTCTPARSALLTGQKPWNHGMLGYGSVAAKCVVWCAVYGVGCVVYGVWCMACKCKPYRKVPYHPHISPILFPRYPYEMPVTLGELGYMTHSIGVMMWIMVFHALTHTPYIIHLTPYTIPHTPYTLHHTPYPIHHAPCTIRHTPYTIHQTGKDHFGWNTTTHEGRAHGYQGINVWCMVYGVWCMVYGVWSI